MSAKKRLGQTALLLLVPALAVGALATWFGLRSERATAAPNPGEQKKLPLVEVEPVRQGAIVRTLALTGEVVAADTIAIAATKEGPVTYCPWREGDEVQAGDKLVEIDREVHRAEVQAAQAALAVAKAKLADLQAGTRPEEIQKAEADVACRQATLQEARKSYQRQAELLRQDFASEQSVDQARERMEVAEAELAAAEDTLRMRQAGPTPTELAVEAAAVEEAAARLALAQAHLAECVIKAPFAGIITRVYVRPGDLASARSPLVEMFAPESLVVRFAVPESYSAGVRRGLRVAVALDALAGRTFAAEVVRVYPQLDEMMRTRTVEARLLDGGELAPHMFARLTLELYRVEDATVAPVGAVLTTPTGAQVAYVVADGKAVERRVETGIEQVDGVQVLAGLAPGEQVVVAGQERLKDGMEVRVAQPGKVAGSPARPAGEAGAAAASAGSKKGGAS